MVCLLSDERHHAKGPSFKVIIIPGAQRQAEWKGRHRSKGGGAGGREAAVPCENDRFEQGG